MITTQVQHRPMIRHHWRFFWFAQLCRRWIFFWKPPKQIWKFLNAEWFKYHLLIWMSKFVTFILVIDIVIRIIIKTKKTTISKRKNQKSLPPVPEPEQRALPTSISLQSLYDGPIPYKPQKLKDIRKLASFTKNASSAVYYDTFVKVSVNDEYEISSLEVEFIKHIGCQWWRMWRLIFIILLVILRLRYRFV